MFIPLQGMLVKKGTYVKNAQINLTDNADKISESSENANHKKPDSEKIDTTESSGANKEKSENENTNSVRYTNRHKCDFCVLVDTSKSTMIENDKMRNGLFLWDKIKNFNILGIKKIKAIGRSLYKFFFENFEAANKCIDNPDLLKNNMRPFIPKSMVETTGVARQIPLNFTEQEIKNNIVSDIPITSITRITRRDPNDKEKFIPTYSVKIAFEELDTAITAED
ncbi:uncharacterized protein LOC118756710 [Rhagoletis pomonella]|uniref:uncharacterized protein LOC118756710 n=1 Tax=Rhagoletis pomonella TaxID=28610 RepID=UPI0017807321|nr:uncharacterized protein LOC118756710 [Rhagoletis pomonella]